MIYCNIFKAATLKYYWHVEAVFYLKLGSYNDERCGPLKCATDHPQACFSRGSDFFHC